MWQSAIVPWNGPFYNAIAKLAPALTAGCSLVLKPAEETPLSAAVLERIVREAGVPEGVVNFVQGYGHTTGAALAAHPGRGQNRLYRFYRGRKADRAGGGLQFEEGHA